MPGAGFGGGRRINHECVALAGSHNAIVAQSTLWRHIALIEVARDQLYISATRVWTPSVAGTALPPQPELRHWFPGAQVLIARAADDFGGAIKGGHNILIISDRGVSATQVAVPALLAAWQFQLGSLE